MSSWGSNEELAAFKQALGGRFAAFVKQDWSPQPGERLDDDLLIRADKNPNTAAARALFPAACRRCGGVRRRDGPGADLGRGF